jgi:hypothetical protein
MRFNRRFPKVLAELHRLDFDYAGGDGIDFEPYSEFLSAADNQSFIRAWTGNEGLTGAELRVFGQDGTGGYAAFWLAHDGKDVLEQPVVFFGSEGELGVIAKDFGDYLWLLAGGLGPYEAVTYSSAKRPGNRAFAEFAGRHVPRRKKTARQILAAARAAFPGFEEQIRARCVQR